MNQILYSERSTSKSNKKIIIVIVVLLVLIISASLVVSNMLEDKVFANVYVGDVDIGMQTKDEAREILQNEINIYQNSNITLNLNGKSVKYTIDEIGINLDDTLENTLNNAFEYGRDKGFFGNTGNLIKSYFNDTNISLDFQFDDEKFNNAINELIKDSDAVATDDTYEISGDKIFITKGHDGNKVDYELSKSYITSAILNDVKNVDIPVKESDCVRIDFDKLYDEVYKAPKNASYVVTESFELIEDENGVYFDIEKAKSDYENLEAESILTIELKESEAEIQVVDLDDELYGNVLATFSNTYDESVTGRVQNLKVATERCNDTILYPGDEFSYNKALGTRTVANGFAPGHSFAGGKVVTTIGGGICQVSSALYNIVLMADLEVTNRVAHGMYVEYVEPSLDATVVDGAIDFTFKNNRKYPVKIGATAENGVVTVTLYGLKDENEPIIEIESVVLETIPYTTVTEKDSTMDKGTTKVVQEPVNGYVSEAYRIEKDSDGNVVSRTLISKDRYIATNEIIKVGTKVEEVIVVPVEPEIVPETTPEVTEKPKYEDEDDGLPPGWDSPESPYAR